MTDGVGEYASAPVGRLFRHEIRCDCGAVESRYDHQSQGSDVVPCVGRMSRRQCFYRKVQLRRFDGPWFWSPEPDASGFGGSPVSGARGIWRAVEATTVLIGWNSAPVEREACGDRSFPPSHVIKFRVMGLGAMLPASKTHRQCPSNPDSILPVVNALLL